MAWGSCRAATARTTTARRERRPLFHRLIQDGFPAGYAIDEDAAMRFVDGQLTEVVTAREGAAAYRVERINGSVIETPLPSRLLT